MEIENNILYKRTLMEIETWNEPFITIAIDFDCTVIESAYPFIGPSLPNCVETLKRWTKDYNVGLILHTMRSGKELDDAVKWFKDNDIPLFGISKHPTQERWTTSPKCHANFCIDDRNVGTNLIYDTNGVPCVDWFWLENNFEPILKRLAKITN